MNGKANKYILVGGFVRKAPDGGKAFCEELIRGFKEPVKILDCTFAVAEEYWPVKFAEDKELFVNHLPGREVEVRLASSDGFVEEIKWADAIFLRGGDPKRLMAVLDKNPGWSEELAGKTLAGTSAGAETISKYYYNLTETAVEDGLGLLSFKVIPHWRSDYNAPNVNWGKAYRELQEYKEDLPILTLAEGEFKIFDL